MSGKTGDDRGPRHVCAGIGQAAACSQLAVAGNPWIPPIPASA
jgi:hypothetical protein